MVDRKDRRFGYGIWLHGEGAEERISKRWITEGCVAFFNPEIVELSSWLPAYTGIVVIAKDATKIGDSESQKTLIDLTRTWLASWNQKDIDSYMGHYSSAFRLKEKDLGRYRDYKKKIFGRYKEMIIEVDTVRAIVHPKYAVTLMNQDFRSDQFRSFGRKVLYWQKEGNGWKIVRESFGSKPLKKNRIDL